MSEKTILDLTVVSQTATPPLGKHHWSLLDFTTRTAPIIYLVSLLH